MSRWTIPSAIFETGARLVSRAARAVLQDQRGQEAMARAVGLAQRGRKRLEELQERALSTAGIPARSDYQELARQLARIKRKTRELSARLAGPSPNGSDDDQTR
jgi:hypothetical protein